MGREVIVTSTVIRGTPEATSPASFRYRFGSLLRAYQVDWLRRPSGQAGETSHVEESKPFD